MERDEKLSPGLNNAHKRKGMLMIILALDMLAKKKSLITRKKLEETQRMCLSGLALKINWPES